jgi:hypothetical protein
MRVGADEKLIAVERLDVVEGVDEAVAEGAAPQSAD